MSEKNVHKTSIGGQAVIEGVMMRGPKDIAIAVRKPDNEIVVEKRPIASVLQKNKILKLPIIRGCISFFESMVVGVKALMFSAQFFDVEGEETESKFDKWLEEKLGDKIKDVVFNKAIAAIVGLSAMFFSGRYILKKLHFIK